MALEDAFLEDIIAHPADDTPRLVYADWLEDQGNTSCQHRAEFIRLQIEQVTTPDGPRLWAIEQREKQLLAAYRSSWVGALKDFVWGEEFRRGFIEEVTIAPEHFLDRGPEVFALAPVRRLRLTNPAARRDRPLDVVKLLAQVADSPLLRQVIGLRLELALPEEGALALAASPYLTELVDLDLYSRDLTARALRGFLEAPIHARLERLSLRFFQNVEAVLGVVASASGLARLAELQVHTGNLDEVAMTTLASAAGLPALRALNLSHNRLTQPGMVALASGPLLRPVETLRLSGNWSGDEAVRQWALHAIVPRLRTLDLSYNQVQGRGMAALARSGVLAGVRTLNLRGNVAGSDGMIALARSGDVSNVRTLLMHFNGIGDEGIRALARSEALAELLWLDLVNNRVTSKGARELARSAHLDKIVRLELERNDVGPREQEELRVRFGSAVTL